MSKKNSKAIKEVQAFENWWANVMLPPKRASATYHRIFYGFKFFAKKGWMASAKEVR